MGATRSKDNANAFMVRTPGAAVLKVLEADGLIVMAHEDDEGEPVARVSRQRRDCRFACLRAGFRPSLSPRPPRLIAVLTPDHSPPL